MNYYSQGGYEDNNYKRECWQEDEKMIKCIERVGFGSSGQFLSDIYHFKPEIANKEKISMTYEAKWYKPASSI